MSGPPKSAAIAANAPARTSSCAFRLAHPDESDRDTAEPEPQRDEWSLGPEHEPQTECRQRGQEDPRQLDRLHRAHPEAFEGRMSPVPG